MYLGKPMPVEFSEICKDVKPERIINRKPDPMRYFNMFSNFLKYYYTGDLPKTVGGIAKVLKEPQYIRDLFYLNETGYKNLYYKEYDDFFKNKSHDQQKMIFQSADYGARTLFEYKQDVEAGDLIEKMVSYYTHGILIQNKAASGESGKISTYCDFIFRNPLAICENGKIPTNCDFVEQPIELKTKFGKTFKNEEFVQIRGSIEKILKTDGMILAIYLNMNKAVLIDPIGKKYRMEQGVMKNGKECVNIYIDKKDIVDFCFWNKNDVSKMMYMILNQKKSRNK